VQQAGPIIDITVIEPIPFQAVGRGIRHEKRRPVEAVLLIKIFDLLLRSGLAQDRRRRFTGYKFD
jgi:hypothetical protein